MIFARGDADAGAALFFLSSQLRAFSHHEKPCRSRDESPSAANVATKNLQTLRERAFIERLDLL